jgi:hypothetical protein
MTNEQAKVYAICALYSMYRDKDRRGYGEHTATDKELHDLLQELRDELHWQLDVLTEEEAEEKGDRILIDLSERSAAKA